MSSAKFSEWSSGYFFAQSVETIYLRRCANSSTDFMSLSEEDVNLFKGYEIYVSIEKCDVPLAPVTRTKEPLRMTDVAQ